MNELHGNVELLLSSVRRRVDQRILAERATLEETLDRIVHEAEVEAERRKDAILAQGRVDAEAACQQCLATAERERRVARLQAREARLTAVFDAADERLQAHVDEGLAPEVVAHLVRQAASSLPPGEVTVTIDAANRARLASDAVDAWRTETHAFRLDDAPLAERHGVVVRSGRASVDATIEGRLAQARDQLRSQVDERLHGDTDEVAS